MFTINDNAKGLLRFVRTPVIFLLIFTFLMSGTVFAFTAGKNERPLTVFSDGQKQVFSTVLTKAEEMLSTYNVEVAEDQSYELYENANGFYLSVGTPFSLTINKDGESKCDSSFARLLKLPLREWTVSPPSATPSTCL